MVAIGGHSCIIQDNDSNGNKRGWTWRLSDGFTEKELKTKVVHQAELVWTIISCNWNTGNSRQKHYTPVRYSENGSQSAGFRAIMCRKFAESLTLSRNEYFGIQLVASNTLVSKPSCDRSSEVIHRLSTGYNK